MTYDIVFQELTMRSYWELGPNMADMAACIYERLRRLDIDEEFMADSVAALDAVLPNMGRTTRYKVLGLLLERGVQVERHVFTMDNKPKITSSPYEKTKIVRRRAGVLEDFVPVPEGPQERRAFHPSRFTGASATPAAPVVQRTLRIEPVALQPYAAPAPAAHGFDAAALVAALQAAGVIPKPAAPAAVETLPPAPVAAPEPFDIPQRDELTRAMIDILATDEFRAAMVATIANVEASKWFWNHMRLMIMEKFDLDLKEQTARALTNRLNLCVKETWDTLDADIKERIDHEFKESQLAQARAESAHLKVDSLRADLRPTIDGLRATTDALRIQVAKLNEIGVEPRLVVLEDHLRQAGRRLLALETGALS